MYTYQRELDKGSVNSGTYRSQESDGTGGICCGPSDQHKNSHRFPSSKRKQPHDELETANEIKVQNVLYH